MLKNESKVRRGGTQVVLRLLGRPAVLLDDAPVRCLPRKVEALLFLLAISDRAWSRLDVAEMLWGDRDSAGRQSLRVALTKIPKPIADHLVRDADTLALSAISSDLGLWLDRCATVLRLAVNGHDADALDRAVGELAAWPGPLLDSFEPDAPDFDDWCYAERERVQRQWQSAVFAGLAATAPADRWQGAEQALGRLLELDPANETAHRWLIRCYLATGRPEAARGQYELCKRQLATLLGAKPAAATQSLLHGVAAGGAAAAEPSPARDPVAQPATAHNLPRQLNSFVGRQREMNEIISLLGKHRLVTLFGAGGIGKTRLALQVGGAALGDYPDGVWLVDLTPVVDPRMVAQATAIALSVTEAPGRPVEDAVADFVSQRRLLIILDNCEHVVSGAADFARRLMQAGDGVRLLATSREWLHVAGEVTYDVPALDVAADAGQRPAAELLAFDAVRLFVERAASARADFRLDADNGAAVADICQRLDGLPLAIELAAARVRTLSVGNLAARLKERLHLPGSGDRSQPTRQQTLDALIDWSYRLLDEDEARLFRCLSVFARGWTLDAAEAVTAVDDVESKDVVELLGRLVEKSLVAFDTDNDRYRLLDVVRVFARAQLGADAEANRVRRRHVEHYLALAETARPHLAAADQGEWLARLDAERENLLAAFRRSAHLAEGSDVGVRLVHALRPYLISRGLITVGLDATQESLRRPGMAERNARRYQALFSAGQICNFSGRWQEARAFLTEGLAIARELGDSVFEAGLLQQLGQTCSEQQDRAAARRYLEAGAALADRLGNQREQAAAYNALGQCLRLEGQKEAAAALYEKALTIARALGAQEYVACLLLNLAMIEIDTKRLDKADRMLAEALAIAVATGSRQIGQSVIEVCAGLAAARSEWRQAARFFGAAERHARQTSLRRDATDDAFLQPLAKSTLQALEIQTFVADDVNSHSLSYVEALEEAGAWLPTANP